MQSNHSAIQDQVRLPLRVAWGIVVQGIRIRLGRSLVTLLGVVLGVAFLMSILSSSMLRGRVMGEIEARQQIAAMMGFLLAESGTLSGRTLVVWRGTEPDDIEQRFLREIFRPGAARSVEAKDFVPTSTDDRPALIVVIGGDLPSDVWESVSPHLRQPVAVFTRTLVSDPSGSGALLRRPPSEEDLQREAQEAAQQKVRTVWILCIAALVTIISISNALLMSVTERFREIGTMKCLGALSSFIRRVFFLESALIGFVGGLAGSLFGMLFAVMLYAISYGWGLVLGSLPVVPLLGALLVCLAAGIIASILAAIYPAGVASRMVPATALRTNI